VSINLEIVFVLARLALPWQEVLILPYCTPKRKLYHPAMIGV